MTLRVRLIKLPLLFEGIAAQLKALGVEVAGRDPIAETSTHVIREIVVSCHRREHSEAVLKAIRAIDGAEIMNFSFSR
jgi:hypothetical protein